MRETVRAETAIDRRGLLRTAMARLAVSVALLGLCLFLPAGTLRYWEAWGYLGVMILCVSVALRKLSRDAPDLLARRFRMREKEPVQRRIMLLAYPFFVAALVIPGLDKRFGWTDVPLPVVIAGDAVVIGAYAAFLRVMKENRFASRIVEVEAGQTVVATGPYRRIRHPMYAAVLVLYMATPLALGSYWGILGMLFLVPVIVIRTLDEERVLREQLDGYAAYMESTRWRILPGVW